MFVIALLLAISYAQTEIAVADEPAGEVAIADEPATEEAVGRRPYIEFAEDKRCRIRENLLWNTRRTQHTRESCEQEARDNNANFYGYEFQLSRCYIATTCDNPHNARTAMGTKWKIWRRDQSRQTGAAPAEPAGLPYIKRAGSDQKCENTGNNEHTVATKPECETEARNNNAEYYSYSSRQKKCFYSTTCSNIVSGRSASRWKIYQRDPNDQTDQAVFQVVGTTHNAITMFAIIGAVTMVYHGFKGVHKMIFATSEFQKINKEMEC